MDLYGVNYGIWYWYGESQRNSQNKYKNCKNTKLAELDVEFQKAQETSASTTDIVAKKVALRDAPADSAIAAASDTDSLKAQWNTDILGTSPYT